MANPKPTKLPKWSTNETPIPTWATSTAYVLDAVVRNGTHIYTCISAGTSASSGGPTGTASSIHDGSGTLYWEYTGVATAQPNVEPSGWKKITGWLFGEAPPGNIFNWLFNNIYTWCLYLDTFIDTLQGGARSWAEDATFAKTVTVAKVATFNGDLIANKDTTLSANSGAANGFGYQGYAGIYGQSADYNTGGVLGRGVWGHGVGQGVGGYFTGAGAGYALYVEQLNVAGGLAAYIKGRSGLSVIADGFNAEALIASASSGPAISTTRGTRRGDIHLTYSSIEPTNPVDGDFWINTSTTPPQLRVRLGGTTYKLTMAVAP